MKKTMLLIRDIIEVYLPIVTFTILFLSFLIQVFFRYVIRNPLTWTQDAIVACFCWTVILGACYTMREKGHVQFSMLYDSYSPKTAAWTRLIGNLIIILTFAILVIPSIKYVQFVHFQKSPTLRLRRSFIFMPFAYFLVSIIGYTFAPVIEDWKVITGTLADSEDHIKGQHTLPKEKAL